MNLLSSFRSLAGNFRASLAEVRKSLELARRRREELLTLPVPAQEFAAMWTEALDRRAAAYEAGLLARVKHTLGDPLVNSESPGVAATSILVSGHNQMSGQEVEGMAAYLMRDLIRERLLAMVERAIPAKKCGPPRAERLGELEKVDAEIASLKLRESEMLSELEAIAREANPG